MLETAAAAMQSAGSLHFELEGSLMVPSCCGDTPIPVSFVGDVQAPDRLRGKVSVSVLGFLTFEMESIVIGDTSYTTNPVTKEWEKTPGLAAALPSPIELTSEGLALLGDVALIGVEELDEGPAYHVRGSLVEGGFAVETSQAVFDVWIDVGDMLVRQIGVEAEVLLEGLGEELESAGISGTVIVVVTMEFSGYGEPVEIEPPEMPTG